MVKAKELDLDQMSVREMAEMTELSLELKKDED